MNVIPPGVSLAALQAQIDDLVERVEELEAAREDELLDAEYAGTVEQLYKPWWQFWR